MVLISKGVVTVTLVALGLSHQVGSLDTSLVFLMSVNTVKLALVVLAARQLLVTPNE
jgi:hypothetical protein